MPILLACQASEVGQTTQMLRALVPLALVLVSCSQEQNEQASQETETPARDPYGTVQLAVSATDPVSAYYTNTCSTAVVKGLSEQLVAELQCLRPNTLKSLKGLPNITLGAGAMPYMQTSAVDTLIKTQKARGVALSVNSALRTLPQQFLLVNWFNRGRCDITAAAPPGTSNHESGVAVDINDYSAWINTMSNNQYRWFGNGDRPHFDYIGPGSISLRGLSVKAFQRLWNRNHPEDKIGEDGVYGDETGKRVARSPVGGFPIGADCTKKDGGTAGADAGGGMTEPEPPPFVPDPVADAPEGPSAELGQVEGGCCAVAAGHGRALSPVSTALGAVAIALLWLRRRSRR
jgi:hypothetical protein